MAEDAEIKWALKVLLSRFSYRSCLGTNKVSKTMFLDYVIVKEFSMSKTKCAYVIQFVLAPIFKNDFVEQINSSLFYSVLFDESLSSSLQQCQMDIHIKFWGMNLNVKQLPDI